MTGPGDQIGLDRPPARLQAVASRATASVRLTPVLRQLGGRSAETEAAEEACLATAEMLVKSPKDVPFALIYLLNREGTIAQRAAVAGFSEPDVSGPKAVPIVAGAQDVGIWPLAEAVRSEKIVTLETLPT
jgi:hypothetical protein